MILHWMRICLFSSCTCDRQYLQALFWSDWWDFMTKIFTVRNEVAKVMFLQACICPMGGVHRPGPGTPPGQVHLPDQVHPPDQVHTQAGTPLPPGTRYTPLGPDTPPAPDQVNPLDEVHPLGPGTPPWDQVHPQTRYTPGQVLPRQVHTPPQAGTPPGPVTPPTRYPPLGRYTPQTRYTPHTEIRPLLRTVRILLECILVRRVFTHATFLIYQAVHGSWSYVMHWVSCHWYGRAVISIRVSLTTVFEKKYGLHIVHNLFLSIPFSCKSVMLKEERRSWLNYRPLWNQLHYRISNSMNI